MRGGGGLRDEAAADAGERQHRAHIVCQRPRAHTTAPSAPRPHLRSQAAKDGDYGVALSKLDQLQQTLTQWRAAIVAKKEAASTPAEPEPEPTPPAESVEYSVNSTFMPEKCKRKAEEGATMRVHYVGKLLTGTKKIFASSFHTGSTPFKFKLGSSEVIDAWNDGLLGMCEGACTAFAPPSLPHVHAGELADVEGCACAQVSVGG